MYNYVNNKSLFCGVLFLTVGNYFPARAVGQLAVDFCRQYFKKVYLKYQRDSQEQIGVYRLSRKYIIDIAPVAIELTGKPGNSP